MTFLWSRRRQLVCTLVLTTSGAVAALAIVVATFSLLTGRLAIAGPTAGFTAAGILLFNAVVSGALWLRLPDRHRPFVRTGERGLEFAATRKDPVLVPGEAIASVRFRGRGPLAVMVVTPTDPALARRAHRGGRDPGRLRRDGTMTFTADIAALSPNSAAVRAAVLAALPEGRVHAPA